MPNGIRIVFIVDDNFLPQIAHELSDGSQEFFEREKTTQ